MVASKQHRIRPNSMGSSRHDEGLDTIFSSYEGLIYKFTFICLSIAGTMLMFTLFLFMVDYNFRFLFSWDPVNTVVQYNFRLSSSLLSI